MLYYIGLDRYSDAHNLFYPIEYTYTAVNNTMYNTHSLSIYIMIDLWFLGRGDEDKNEFMIIRELKNVFGPNVNISHVHIILVIFM